jgi:flagellar hook protein FlgE
VAIPIDANAPELAAQATTRIKYEALLTLERPPGDVYQTQVPYWDGTSGADATRQTMVVEWTRGTGENNWTVGFRETGTGPILSTQAITFEAPTPGTEVANSNQGNTPDVPSVPVTLSSGQQITFDFSKVASYFGLEIPPATVADGYPDGELLDIRFDGAGNLIGNYSNNVSQNLYQLSLAYFQNDNALEAVTGNNYRRTPEAGDRAFYQPQGGSNGSIELGFLHIQALENSNVALEEQFQDLITTQRAYQSASKIITVSDAMSKTAINTKK